MHVFVARLDYRNDLKHQNIVTEILAVEPGALVKFKTFFYGFGNNILSPIKFHKTK